LVKRPDILVIDGAFASFDEARSQQLMQLLLDMFDQQSLFMVLPNDRQAGDFDVQMRFRDGQIITDKTAAPASRPSKPEPDAPQRIAGEVA
jgi:putative ABC transport system ATP-binding protein